MSGFDIKPTVLVVEDHEDIRLMIEAWLESKNFRVVTAVDGWQAVQVALRHRPELILMDLHLPVLDGVEVVCLLRENEALSSIPIVAVTAHDSVDARADAADAGCDEFLTKPIDFDSLAQTISRFVANH